MQEDEQKNLPEHTQGDTETVKTDTHDLLH